MALALIDLNLNVSLGLLKRLQLCHGNDEFCTFHKNMPLLVGIWDKLNCRLNPFGTEFA